MTRLRLYYDGGEFYQDFTFEKLAGANEVLDTIAAARPDLSVEREERAQSAILQGHAQLPQQFDLEEHLDLGVPVIPIAVLTVPPGSRRSGWGIWTRAVF